MSDSAESRSAQKQAGGCRVKVVWEGKRSPCLPAAPTLLPTAGSQSSAGGENCLVQGDCLAVMAALLAQGTPRFDLIYIDPPFFTGREFTAGGSNGDAGTTGGFSDVWQNDLGAYLQWLLDRLHAARMLLSETGCLYLHLSWHSAHYAKAILDEVFGPERFQNEIVWCYREAINSRRRWNRKHDTLLFYSRNEQFTFNCDSVLEPYSESTVRKFRLRDERGPYRLMGRGIKGSPICSKRDVAQQMELDYPGLTYRHYLGTGTLPVDYWLIDIENQASKIRTGYPTQKPEALLERILLASTNEGDLIGDFCCGSGTTLAVADKLGRRWFGCDIGDAAIQVCSERLQKQNAKFQVLAAH